MKYTKQRLDDSTARGWLSLDLAVGALQLVVDDPASVLRLLLRQPLRLHLAAQALLGRLGRPQSLFERVHFGA